MHTRREILAAGIAGAMAMAIPFGAAGRTTRNNEEPAFASARTLAAKVASEDIGIVELTEYFIRRIETYDSHINAVVVRDFDRALDAARQADGRSPGGDNQPLYGVPITVKESFNVQGLATTWGVLRWKDRVASEDAHVVKPMPGLPSTVFPTGLSEGGLPICLQAVGGEFNDLATIEFAGLVEREFAGT